MPDVEDTVREAFAVELGHHDFTDEDSFFYVGGHSLRGLRVMRSVSTAVGVKLPLRLLFEHPSVRELSSAVTAVVAADEGSEARLES